MDLRPGEQVFYHGHPSWRSMVWFYVRGLVLSILLGALVGLVTGLAVGHVQDGWVIAAVLLGFCAAFTQVAVLRLRTTYTITDQRLTIETGLLGHDLHETRLERVQNVGSRQTLLERVLGVGTVDFDTAGGAEYSFSFSGVAAPRELVRTVDRALRSAASPPAAI